MPRPGYDEVVLLTGFPSFVARRMCGEILRTPGAFVYAVVRPKLLAEARGALDLFSLGERSRVRLLDGDVAAMDLGLSRVEIEMLAAEVDRIHHCAEVSYHGAERSLSEQVNVGGMREVLEVAAVCSGLKCLVVHSTAGVSGDRTGSVAEDDLRKGQNFRNVYEETKGRAEKLARGAMAKIPIAVVRPATVVGDSVTGEIDRFDGPYLFVLLIVASPPDVALPLPGRGDAPLNLVPVDYVVRAARAIGLDARAPGRTFHLVDRAPLPTRRVFELVARAGGKRGPRGSIPANIAKALLRTPGLDRIAKSPRAFLDMLVTEVAYDASNAEELLAGTGIECPPFESYVDRLVDYVKLRVRERRERKSAEVDDPLV